MYQLKTTHIYHLTASVGQDPGMALLCPLTSGFLMDWNQGKLWAMVQMGFFKKPASMFMGLLSSTWFSVGSRI